MKYEIEYLAYSKDGACLHKSKATTIKPNPIVAKSEFETDMKKQDTRIATVIVLSCTEAEMSAMDFLKNMFGI